MEERYYWLAFSLVSGVGPATFFKLRTAFGNAKNAWDASSAQRILVIGEKINSAIEKTKGTLSLTSYLARMKKNRVGFVTYHEREYPVLLKEIARPPMILFVKHGAGGDCIDLNIYNPCIAIVGARKMTSYGNEVTRFFTSYLVEMGYAIVSGLAMGVDTCAHKTTLEEKGKTIAVLGCGVDCCVPVENQRLYDEIVAKGGCIISELPLGHPPSVGSFPARNRIVAGLSHAVLVTEGTKDSGSVITAEYALKEKRKVFAVPGQITSEYSKGPLSLLQKGAQVVTSGDDIVNALQYDAKGVVQKKKKQRKGDTMEEQIILDLLQKEPLVFDQIVRITGMSLPVVGSVVSLLEIKGYVYKSSTGEILLHTLE